MLPQQKVDLKGQTVQALEQARSLVRQLAHSTSDFEEIARYAALGQQIGEAIHVIGPVSVAQVVEVDFKKEPTKKEPAKKAKREEIRPSVPEYDIQNQRVLKAREAMRKRKSINAIHLSVRENRLVWKHTTSGYTRRIARKDFDRIVNAVADLPHQEFFHQKDLTRRLRSQSSDRVQMVLRALAYYGLCEVQPRYGYRRVAAGLKRHAAAIWETLAK